MPLVATKELNPKQIFSKKIVYVASRLSPHFDELTEDQLIAEANPTEIEWKLRIRLWQEYRTLVDEVRVGKGIRKIRNDLVCENICGPNWFLQLLDKPHKAAFLLRPVEDFEKEVETQLQIASKKLFQLLNMDIMSKKTGQVDPKLGNLLLNTIGMIADRARGLAITRTQSVNVNVNKNESKPARSLDTQIQLDERLKELEAKLAIEGEVIESRPNTTKKAED